MSESSLRFDNPFLLEKDTVLSLARLFASELGTKVIDFGAAEPLIWNSRGESIVDLVRDLAFQGFSVALTTNGAVLRDYVEDLASAGLTKLRVSWPSFHRASFEGITGRLYEPFLEGVIMAVQSGVDLKFNRLLLRGYTDDLPDHLAWMVDHQCVLKIYDLYWTPTNSKYYARYYQGVQEIVEKHVMPQTDSIEEIPHSARPRLRYKIGDRACVEVKGRPVRSHQACHECSFQEQCNEGFLDYLRIEPNGSLTPCYLRSDLSVDLAGSDEVIPAISESWEIVKPELTHSKVCLTVTSQCNQSCRFPRTNLTWCLRGRQR